MQREFLTSLYKATYGHQLWKNKKFWLDQNISYCSWYGIICDIDSNIISLNLRGNYLMNYIPDIFEVLEELEVLDLGENTFESYIPSSICKLPHLKQLMLDNSNIKGEIPQCLCDKNLTLLDLSKNNLSGYNQGCKDIKILLYDCNNIHGIMNYQLQNVSLLNTQCNNNLVGCEQRLSNQNGVLLCSNKNCYQCQHDQTEFCPYVFEGSSCGDYVQVDYIDTYYQMQQQK